MAEGPPLALQFASFLRSNQGQGENESRQHWKVDQLIDHLLLHPLFLPYKMQSIIICSSHDFSPC